jgi:DNA-binding transcriptional MerR regulator
MFKIGDFSHMCRVPVSALRYYADLGLLLPARVDQFTGYRYYSLDQLPRLNRILALKDLGLSLDQIGQVLAENLSAEQLRGMLRLREAEIRQQVKEAEAQLARVEARLKHIEMENAMPTHEVVIKTIEATQVLSIRQNSPTPSYVGALLGETCGVVAQSGIDFGGAPFTIFHDTEFKPENLDVEIAIPVSAAVRKDVPLDGGRKLTAHKLAGIEAAACLLHAGDFESIAQSYEALGKWIEANGYQIAGPPREVYLRAPDQEGGALTEIQWPVSKL